MKINSKEFRVRPGDKVRLKEWPTTVKQAYEDLLHATSTQHAPWHIVPADNKEDARLIVSQIVIDALQELKMAYPKATPKRRRELKTNPQAAGEMKVN